MTSQVFRKFTNVSEMSEEYSCIQSQWKLDARLVYIIKRSHEGSEILKRV